METKTRDFTALQLCEWKIPEQLDYNLTEEDEAACLVKVVASDLKVDGYADYDDCVKSGFVILVDGVHYKLSYDWGRGSGYNEITDECDGFIFKGIEVYPVEVAVIEWKPITPEMGSKDTK